MMRPLSQPQFWRHFVVNDNNISTFYILDLDRTIFNTEASIQVMRGVVALHSPDLAVALEQRFDEYTLLGESFSMRDFILERVGEQVIKKIDEKYLEFAVQQDLLMPGARELITFIRAKRDAEFAILTYGAPLGQALKINGVTELRGIPYLVTSETYKGALIASWRQTDNLYHLPEEFGAVVTKNIVFVDDKPFSFKGLPIDLRGYMVQSMYDAGIEKLPLNVKVVGSLGEVLSAEKKLD